MQILVTVSAMVKFWLTLVLGACSLLGTTVGGNIMEVMAGRIADNNQRVAWINV